MENKSQALMQVAHDGHDDCSTQWRNALQNIIATHDLTGQRSQVEQMAQELNMSALDCAAAMLFILTTGADSCSRPREKLLNALPSVMFPPKLLSPKVKLVRYRLDLGNQDQLSLEQLKKVIVEESGVDINNIFIVRVQGNYTLVDLPDGMPQEIFHHLKTVEINGKKLDIRRVKAHNKKHSNRRRKQHRPVAATSKGAG